MNIKKGLIISIILVSAIILLIGIFAIIYFMPSGKAIEKSTSIKPESEQAIEDNCKNLNLTDTTECLVKNINLIYNYTLHQDNSDYDYMLINGGNCVSYSQLYVRLFKYLGFNAIINGWSGVAGEYYGHNVAIAYDGKDYCLIDQINYSCQQSP